MSNKALFQALIIVSSLACLNGYAADTTPSAQPAAATTPAMAESTNANASSLTGTVQQFVQPTITPATALTASDYLDIQYKPGSNKHKMQEYTLVLNNKQPKHLEVLQLEVVNGLSEQAYLMAQQQQGQATRRFAGGMLRSLTSVATSFVPYAGIGSMAAYQAIGVGSNVLYNTANMVENSSGAADYTSRIVQQASNIFLSPNQPFQCMAVTPDKQTPVVKIVFKDLESNQIFDMQK